jgi:N-acyl-D-aspartate/D-glutamate deacylase
MINEFDILIENATIVDGINKAHKGSIGVKGERVSAVGKVSGDAKKVVDATGLTAMPGFVDPHSHADSSFLWYPNCESAVMQGCTTVLAGQCGGSPAPLREMIRPPRQLVDEIYELKPYLYYPPPLLPLDTVNKLMKEKYGWTIDYQTMEEYFKVVEDKGISINYAPLVGHGTIRIAVMGEDYKRHSTKTELNQMKELIHQAMKEGCIGMSTGLDYDPDVFADKSEIDECVTVLKEYGGLYDPHWRRTGRRREIKAGTGYIEPIDGIIEVIDTCRKTGVKLNIAHLAPGWHTIPPMTPEMGKTIGEATVAPIDKARGEGLDVTFDVIPWQWWEPFPYICGSHFAQWLRLLGSREKLAEWLKVDEFRKKAWDEIETGKLFQRVVINPCLNKHWAENFKIVEHKNSGYAGKTLAQVAEKLEKDPWNTLCDIIVEDPDSKGAHTDYRGNEEQMKVMMKHPAGAVCLDVMVVDDKVEQKTPPWKTPYPGTYYGYIDFLTRYVRDSNFLTIEEAVQQCATNPAKNVNIKDRGIIRVGAYADISLMDFPNLSIVGHPELSTDYPTGIQYVFVNGVIVVEKGKHTGIRQGKILKRE